MSLYLLINLFTISIPLLLSFDKRVHFFTSWKYLIPAMLVTMVFFIAWDVSFTSQGIWGFNPEYHSHIMLWGLPLGEFLFFISVPYASIFTIQVLQSYFPGFRLGSKPTRLLSFFLMAVLIALALLNISKTYTAVNFFAAALVIGLVLAVKPEILRSFLPAYLVILFPFGLVNGILTGSFIEEQVVWYKDQAILGLRLGTIPIEDIFYGMTLILLNYFLMELFRSRVYGKKNVSE